MCWPAAISRGADRCAVLAEAAVSWCAPGVSSEPCDGSTPLCTRSSQFARMTRVLLVVVVFLALADTARADTLKVGTLTLRSCGAGAYCGKLSRPLDPARPAGRRIDIAFRWYRGAEDADRAADRRGRGRARVSVDGHARGVPRDLRAARAPARDAARRQSRDRRLGADRLQGRAVVHRAHLGQRVRAPCRALREVHRAPVRRGASALFSTAYAVDDLAAVLRALRIRSIDLFGDSYGDLLRAGLRRPPPARRAQGRARLELPAPRHGPVVRDLG